MRILLANGVVDTTIEAFRVGLIDALPKLLTGIVFVSLAYLAIKFVVRIIRTVLEQIYPSEQQLVVDFFALIAGTFMWFGVGLILLNLVGLDEIAASLGTTAGFIGLGVSYALSNMIADTVAGVYLLRDPDFNVGDSVAAESVTGTVSEIGLPKSRFQTDEGTVVIANRTVESRWTKRSDAGP